MREGFSALSTADGLPLTKAEYLAAFNSVFPCLTGRFDKLEAGQQFDETGYAPWDAHVSGDTERARALLEAERPALAAKHFDQARRSLSKAARGV